MNDARKARLDARCARVRKSAAVDIGHPFGYNAIGNMNDGAAAVKATAEVAAWNTILAMDPARAD